LRKGEGLNLLTLVKYYLKYKPDIINHISWKPIILGSLAAKFTNCKNVVNTISGFGYVFANEQRSLTQKIMRMVIISTFKNKYNFVLQNSDDYNFVKSLNLVEPSNLTLIKGSGVDINHYAYSVCSDTEYVKLLFPARLLYDKGLMEYIQAARTIRNFIKGKALFLLAGDCDEGNPASIRKNKLLDLLEDGFIEWIGYQKKMADIYKSCDIVVLPSYREGLPKSLIEAMAIGRPIITTNAPGCNECVINGYNGLLVPVKNVPDLAEAMLTLINDKELRYKFGKNSRLLVEKEFSIDLIVHSTFDLYDKIFARSNPCI
jgi:glycosyltransferase involved in cell wall biosynthesis